MAGKGKAGQDEARKALQEKAAELGLILTDPAVIGAEGGRNSRKYLTPERRRELGQKAARARWGSKKREKKR